MIVPILALGMTVLTAVGVIFKTVVELKQNNQVQEQKYEGLIEVFIDAPQITKEIKSNFSVTKSFQEPKKYIYDILKHDTVDVNEVGIGCPMPYIDPFNKEIMALEETLKNITCDGVDWVKCRWSVCSLDSEATKNLKNVTCGYKYIIYKNDSYYYVSGDTHKRHGSEKFILVYSDHVSVSCKASGSSWQGFASGFRTVNVTRTYLKPEDTVNVLIIAFDSVSTNRFIRHMPNSYKYLKQELGAIFYNKYNVVGDGTAAAMFAMLFGASEQESPDMRTLAGHFKVNHTRLLFHKLKTNGYRTAYFEDFGTFQFRHNGFAARPADHTLRALLTEVALNRGNKYCFGAKPKYKFMMDKTEDFFKLNGKKFCFAFIADISHDGFNGMGVADHDLVRLLKNLKLNGELNNTLTFIIGDHGYSTDRIKAKYHGKLEIRQPLMAIILPENLTRIRPDIVSAVKANADVLTTPYDIHTTILDAVNMKQYWNKYKADGSSLYRGLSLFKPIPSSRSCGDAGIDKPQWCACHRWVSMNPLDTLSQRAGQAVVDKMNELTLPYRSKCKKYELKLVLTVERLQGGTKMLKYSGPADEDGYYGKYNDYEPWYDLEYKIQIMVTPTEIFAVNFTYLSNDDKFSITLKGITRLSDFNCNVSYYIAEVCHCRQAPSR